MIRLIIKVKPTEAVRSALIKQFKTVKKNVIVVALMLGTLGISTTACSDNNAFNKLTEPGMIEEVPKGTSIEVKEVVFKKGKLIEVAFLSIKEGMAQQLNEAYFPKVMPIVTEYGGKPLMTIEVMNIYSDEIKAQMVVFFEWPNAAKKEAFEKDPRFLKIKKIRDEALSFLKLSYFEVDKDSPVQLDGSKFYEVYGMSMNKEKGHLMQQYFEKAGPIVMNDYGVQFALSLTPVIVHIDGHHNYVPQTFGMAIWPSEAFNEKFFGSAEYAAIKHLKEEALERIDVWQGAVMLGN